MNMNKEKIKEYNFNAMTVFFLVFNVYIFTKLGWFDFILWLLR